MPELDEILDVLKYMTPIMREKMIDYCKYAALALAQDSLLEDDRRMEKGWFAIISKLMQIFQWLKLQVKQDNK